MSAWSLAIAINGVDVRTRTRVADLVIHDVLNDAPNFVNGTIDGSAPIVGHGIVVGLNTVTGSDRIFGGTIQNVSQTYEGVTTNRAWNFLAIDYTFLLNRRRPFGTWTTTSATTIVQSLITNFSSGFTSTNVAAALPNVSVNFDGSEGFGACLSQIASLIGGYWYVDEGKDVHFFVTEATAAPDALDSNNRSLLLDPPVTYTTDLSQIRTRVYGRGHGEPTLTDTAVGATVMRVDNAAAWFSAGGGSAISETQRLTYTGIGRAYEFTATDWLAATSSALTSRWNDVLWVETLGLFVTVGDGAGVMTSPDGFTWTSRTPSSVSGWNAIAWAQSLTLLVVVSTNGLVMSSPDGITWTARTAATADPWWDIAWSPALSLFAATAISGTFRVMTSPDGINWTSRTAAAALSWQSVAWSPSLALFAAASGDAVTNTVMTSPDGITWTRRTTAGAITTIAWASGPALFVGMATSAPMTSPDGINWTVRTGAMPTNNWFGLTDASELGLLVATSDGASNNIATSSDGIVWTAAQPPASASWRAIAWSPSLGRLVGVGYTTAPASKVMTNSSVVFRTLTGIPPSGAGSITTAIGAGSVVNIWVQRDDATAQTALASMEGGDGIHEDVVADERRNKISLIALCDARLALFKNPIVTLSYATQDIKTKSGKTIHVNLTAPTSLSGDFVIQDVTIGRIDVAPGEMPVYTVTASSVRFSLEDVLRHLLAA